MQIRNFGYNYVENDGFSYNNDLKNHCCFILFYTPTEILTQNGIVEIDGVTGMLWTAGQKQYYNAKKGHKLIHDFLYLDFDVAKESYMIKGIPVFTPIYFSDPEFIISTFKDINRELMANTAKRYKYEIIPRYIEILFYRIHNSLDFQSINYESNPHFRKLCDLRSTIYKNVNHAWTIEEMSAFIHLSPSYFQNMYKKYFLVSPTNDLICARIGNAKSLLLYSTSNVGAIAEKCGYKNVEHFIRQFKKNTGLTPHKYRSIHGK